SPVRKPGVARSDHSGRPAQGRAGARLLGSARARRRGSANRQAVRAVRAVSAGDARRHRRARDHSHVAIPPQSLQLVLEHRGHMESLKHHFLLAMPDPRLAGDYFANSITYIAEHNADGALGFVVNKPLELSLEELLSQLGISTTPRLPQPVMS